MNVEIKNLKTMPSLSDETLAFTATIFVDGKRTAVASNHGTGGCNDYEVLDAEAFAALKGHAEAWVEQQDDPVRFEQVDQFVGHLIERIDLLKTAKRFQKRGAKHVMLVQKGKGQFGYYEDEFLVALTDPANAEKVASDHGAEQWEVLV